jgi:hypothetical protein
VEPLEVTFDRPLDHGLVARCLHIEDAAGRIGGSSTVGHEERSWRFAPAAPWLDAPHHLVVDAVLEDVAGNSVQRVFDRDLSSDEDTPRDGGPVQLLFHPT